MVSAEKAGLRAGRSGAVRKGVRGWLTALPFILPGLILVAVFYLGGEWLDAVTVQDNVSHLTHIVGGLCGAILGFAMRK